MFPLKLGSRKPRLDACTLLDQRSGNEIIQYFQQRYLVVSKVYP